MQNVLIVDDSGLSRLAVKHMLENSNYRVFEAFNGEQVLMNRFHNEYSLKDMHVVLLDIYMAPVDGYVILERLAPKYPNISFIVMSGERRKENVIKCIDLGARDYLLKPFDKEALLEKIHLAVQKSTYRGDPVDVDKKTLLENTLLLEIERAIRGKSSFTIACFKMSNDIPSDTLTELAKHLRKIDSVVISDDLLHLFLPYTKAEGFEIVYDRFFQQFVDNKLALRQGLYVFPDDFEEVELIKSYMFQEIQNIIVKKIID